MVLSTFFIQWTTSLLFFKAPHKILCFNVHQMKDLINRGATNLLRLWPVELTDVFRSFLEFSYLCAYIVHNFAGVI